MKKLLLFTVSVLVPCALYADEPTKPMPKGCPFPIKKLGSRTEGSQKETAAIASPTTKAITMEAKPTMSEEPMIGKEAMPTAGTESMMIPEEPMTPMPGEEGVIGEEAGASMMPKPITRTSAVKEMSTSATPISTTPTGAATGDITTIPEQVVTPTVAPAETPASASQDIFKF